MNKELEKDILRACDSYRRFRNKQRFLKELAELRYRYMVSHKDFVPMVFKAFNSIANKTERTWFHVEFGRGWL